MTLKEYLQKEIDDTSTVKGFIFEEYGENKGELDLFFSMLTKHTFDPKHILFALKISGIARVHPRHEVVGVFDGIEYKVLKLMEKTL